MELQNEYSVGIYCRLSRDDNNGNLESMSISNQKQILSDYVKEKGWTLTEVYIDDGYTGTNFERPDFKRMIRDVERGLINCIVTKDLSRFGRNYVQTGYYTEDYFVEKNVRFIAINDSIDTFQANNDIAPFQNILNEYYPRAVSKAVRQVKKKGAEEGKFMGSKAPYGYVKSPADKHLLLIDEEAASVVRHLFTQFVLGESARYIAGKLNSEGVLSPRAYYYNQIGRGNPNPNESATWCSNTVMQLLRNSVYIGNMVQGKRKVVSFKTKKRRFVQTDDWIVVENTHEPIIDKELWLEVQKRIATNGRRIKTNSNAEISLFAGILKCADCGGALAFNVKRQAHGNKHIYKCSRYANHGKGACTAHYISEDKLIELIKADIRQNAVLAAADEDALISRLLSQSDSGHESEIQSCRSKMNDIKKRIAKIDSSVKSLFEEKCAGNVPESLFKNLLADYERERSGLESKLLELSNLIVSLENATNDVGEWVSKIKQYISLDELDRETVVELIDSITVSETYTQDGVEQQNITIKYKFVGCLNTEKEKSIA